MAPEFAPEITPETTAYNPGKKLLCPQETKQGENGNLSITRRLKWHCICSDTKLSLEIKPKIVGQIPHTKPNQGKCLQKRRLQYQKFPNTITHISGIPEKLTLNTKNQENFNLNKKRQPSNANNKMNQKLKFPDKDFNCHKNASNIN